VILNFNYNNAIRQASQIESVAGELRGLANNRLSGALGSVNAAWDGEASKLFLNHGEETKRRILMRSEELAEIARRIRRAASVIRETEERAEREIK
jgi:uncharacterized protein YukE